VRLPTRWIGLGNLPDQVIAFLHYLYRRNSIVINLFINIGYNCYHVPSQLLTNLESWLDSHSVWPHEQVLQSWWSLTYSIIPCRHWKPVVNIWEDRAAGNCRDLVESSPQPQIVFISILILSTTFPAKILYSYIIPAVRATCNFLSRLIRSPLMLQRLQIGKPWVFTP